MQPGITFPESLENLLVLRTLGEEAAAKAETGYLSKKELAAVTAALLELSDRFNGIDAAPLGDYMRSRWPRAAYLLYFLPANFAKLWSVLAELKETFAFSESLSVLDAASGPGSLSLAMLDFAARETPVKLLRLTALDSSREALEDLSFLAKQYAASLAAAGTDFGVTVRTQVTNLAAAPGPEGPFDIILFGDSLNELFRDSKSSSLQRAHLVAEYARRLKPDGRLIVIEPALKDMTRALQAVRDTLLGEHGLSVCAPCFAQGPCPMTAPGRERDWCHIAALWTRPAVVRRIDEFAERSKFVLKFSYLVISKAPSAAAAESSNRGLFRVVGDRIVEKGKSHVLLCGATGCRAFTLLTRDENPATKPFLGLHRGDVIAVSNYDQKGNAARLTKDSTVTLLRQFSRQKE